MRVISLDKDNKIESIKFVGEDYILQDNEIKTDLGEMGQVQQTDGNFITPPILETETKLTLEEQILVETQYQTALLEMNILGGI